MMGDPKEDNHPFDERRTASMIEQIQEDLWRIEVPLPGNPLKSINAYYVKGEPRSLLIDTGLDRKVCLDAIRSGLDAVGADPDKTDFFITHMHADHSALVPKLARESSRVYFNGPDAEVFKEIGHWEVILRYAGRNGFPEDELRAALQNHPGYKHGATKIPDLTLLEDGDRIEVGNYRFTCVQTPGHTRGHMCLFEPEKRILLSGDHILIDITPNIQCWREEMNPLDDYLASLDKVYALEVDLVLPGHRRLFRNCRERIDELKAHHERRADEALGVLGEGSRDAYQVASQMTWDLDYASWEHFPVAQKWFATGEAIAHLMYLEGKGEVSRNLEANNVTFSRRT
jgi:glyoxylase-like metal-dependent hydrolase (beta-lactamase superfamily II)